MKKIFYTICTALFMGIILLGITTSTTSCVQDLNHECIDTANRTSVVNVDGLFVKCYATLALTGQTGPAGNGDVAGIDEGTSAFYRMMYSLNEYCADQVYWIWADVGVADIRSAEWTATNDLCRGLYSRLYFDITCCNQFLVATEDMKSDAEVATKRAEVKFLRCLNYYYLLDMFGNVPLALEENISKGINPTQISRKELYNWITDELVNEVEPNLADAGHRVSYYRVDKAAAWLLLSRIYLNQEVYTGEKTDLQKAADYAYEVINSGYELASQYKYLFMGDNDNMSAVNDAYKEIILPIAQDGQNTQSYGAAMFLIASTRTPGVESWGITESWKCIRSRRELVKLFLPDARPYEIDSKLARSTNNEALMTAINKLQYHGGTADIIAVAGDDRAMLMNYGVYNDSVVHVCNLYKENASDQFLDGWSITKFTNSMADPSRVAHDSQWPDMDVPLMRKAEAYLNYAEAILRGATAKGMTADDAVNALRTRANTTTKSGWTLDEILDERGREFYSEGYRRSDLIRFGKFNDPNFVWELKGGKKTGTGVTIPEYRNIFPIPSSDIVASNGTIQQNPGY